jgi:hypothetical protein
MAALGPIACDLLGGDVMTCGTKDGKTHLYTPMKAIRRKCLDCSCGSPQEVSLCPVHNCSLHPYRFGRRPGTAKKETTPAQMERLKRAREARLNGRISDSSLSENREKLAKALGEG